MKILVPTKRVADPDQKIRTTADGTAIEEADVPFVVNPFDAIAIEEALRIRENAGDEVEVIAVGIGTDAYEKELRTALAMGVDRAVRIDCDAPLDPWNVANILKAVVEREQPDMVLMGKQAVDDDANQTGQFLAALLDWPQATFASKIKIDGGALTVSRETDSGIEIVGVSLPAVVTTDLRLNEPRYASLPAIMKAKRKPIDAIAVNELNVALEPRVELVSVEVVSSKRDCKRVNSVDELIHELRETAKVI